MLDLSVLLVRCDTDIVACSGIEGLHHGKCIICSYFHSNIRTTLPENRRKYLYHAPNPAYTRQTTTISRIIDIRYILVEDASSRGIPFM